MPDDWRTRPRGRCPAQGAACEDHALIGRLKRLLERKGSDTPSLPLRSVWPPPADYDFNDVMLERLTGLRALAEDKYKRKKEARMLVEVVRGAVEDRALIPPLSGRAGSIVAMCADPKSPPADRLRLSREDPELQNAIMRLAVSPFYETTNPCGSIQEAVMRIGPGGFRSVVLRMTISDVFGTPPQALRKKAEDIWEHTLRVATLSRRLALSFQTDPENAFVAGLLHNSGKLVLLAALRLHSQREPAVLRAPAGFRDFLFDALDEPLGAAVANQWGLGDNVVSSIAAHRRNPSPDDYLPGSEVVFLAHTADRAAWNHLPFDLDDVMDSYGLSGSPEMASRVLAEPWWETDV